jgi:hypothetical protein
MSQHGGDSYGVMHPPMCRQKEVSKYSGKSDLEDYLCHFQAVAEWNGWDYREKGLQLAINLTGEAMEVMAGLLRVQQYNYDELRQALANRFCPVGRESHYSHQLMNRKCEVGEDVNSYGHAIRRLVSKAYPGNTLDERLLIDMYIRGLPTLDMKRHVHLQKPLHLSDAISYAVEYEAFERPVEVEDRMMPKVASVTVKDAKAMDDLAKTLERIEESMRGLKGERANAKSNPNTCPDECSNTWNYHGGSGDARNYQVWQEHTQYFPGTSGDDRYYQGGYSDRGMDQPGDARNYQGARMSPEDPGVSWNDRSAARGQHRSYESQSNSPLN